ncbi:SusC/RagA family TonB-linked outer membrane protein [Pedobacter cryotolerans]|uniref:TonB-dependent receptor n=1 Tax=Pedobacter cryotolerans TaxID=2571270 RepID=A0A4U1BVP3_9SPHI|nr:TonB-dependent receptor [Pedobacter cryotolerans]TKB96610.1 TonB-dependent receptor [Pedobacter cryotolerans]
MLKFKPIHFRKITTMVILLSLFSINLFAQNRTVSGKVVDQAGLPLPGASVKLKIGTAVASTGLDGSFTIVVPSNGAVLVVSYLGFVTKEVTAQTAPMTIQLQTDQQSLNEVVVVGYGTQRRKDITGSVVSVSGDALREVPTTNVIDQLKGRAAGVDIQSNSTQLGSSGQIRIRGERSLGATQGAADGQNSPLIVLDGVPFTGGINEINPNDIETLDILKDASATAIYGSRGASGVILITTKRGRAGKAVISYDAFFGLNERLAEYDFFNGEEFAAFKLAAARGNSISPGTNPYALTEVEAANLAAGVNTNWQDVVFRQGFTTDHALSISGGSEATKFSVGAGYRNEEGIVYGQNYNRITLRTTLDHQVNKRLKIGFNSLNSLGNSEGGNRFPVGGTLRISPLFSPTNPDGSINLRPQVGTLDVEAVNPLTIRDDVNINPSRRLATFNSIYGEFQIIDGLKFRTNVGLTYGQVQGGAYTAPNTFYNASRLAAQSSASVTNSENWAVLWENLILYNKTFAEHHNVSFTGLFSMEKNHNQNSGFSANGIPADYLQNYNLAQGATLTANNGGFTERGLISYMARLNYTFKGKYLLTATIRRDGSSVLSPGFQYTNYPAIGLGWNISEEGFMKNVKPISQLKLRAGWGVTANQSIAPYSTQGLLSSGTTYPYNFGATGQLGALVTSLANTSLGWESTVNYNFGLDFGLFNNRITGAIEYYTQETSDILQSLPLPLSGGAGNTNVNAGRTKGKGYEFSISSDNIVKKDGFNWSTDFYISKFSNEITFLREGLLADFARGWVVGQPFNIIRDYKKTGIWQSDEAAEAARYSQIPGQIKVEDLNNDGTISAADLQIIGNFQPDFDAGFTNRFSYKSFDLSIVTFARIGQTVALPYLTADGSAQGYPFFNNSRANQYKVNYWTPLNPTNDFPAPDASADRFIYASTLAYRDGSFIKVRSINFGYNLSSKLLAKTGLSSVRVYATAVNPFILWSPLVRSGLAIDPEGNGYGGVATSNGSTVGQNVTGRAITVNLNNPPTRTFQLGVNVKF